jgi:hypothetical protein
VLGLKRSPVDRASVASLRSITATTDRAPPHADLERQPPSARLAGVAARVGVAVRVGVAARVGCRPAGAWRIEHVADVGFAAGELPPIAAAAPARHRPASCHQSPPPLRLVTNLGLERVVDLVRPCDCPRLSPRRLGSLSLSCLSAAGPAARTQRRLDARRRRRTALVLERAADLERAAELLLERAADARRRSHLQRAAIAGRGVATRAHDSRRCTVGARSGARS